MTDSAAALSADSSAGVPDAETFGITVVSRAYHADLLDAARKLGSIKALAEHLGVAIPTVADWVGLRSFPTLDTPRKRRFWLKRWPEVDKKLFALTGKTTRQLFPGFVRLSGVLDAPKVTETTREFSAGDMRRLAGRPAELPPPERSLDLEGLRERLGQALDTLTYREREVLKLRYGLGGGDAFSLEETARVFKVTRERVRQVELKAIRRLQDGGPRQAALAPFADALLGIPRGEMNA
jgi:RNA polymerase sigma factor (sigma-70 family)